MSGAPVQGPGDEAEPRREGGWKRRVPWTVKLAGKVVGGAVPAVSSAIRRVGGYDHGPMDDLRYVRYWIFEHLRRCSLTSLDGIRVLELGPGDAITTALLAAGLGADSTTLIDEADFATGDVELYVDLASRLRHEGIDVPELQGSADREEVLRRCRARYLTSGVASLASLDAGSIDASWSQAVLEHVRLAEFDQLLEELHRVHRPSTKTSHRIDLQDHLAASINTLRIPTWAWERPLIWRSGAYTNRLRASAITERFAAAGFSVEEMARATWTTPPVPRQRLRGPFRTLSEEDLVCAEIDLVALRSP